MSIDTRFNADLPRLDLFERRALEQAPAELAPADAEPPLAVDAGELVLDAPAWDQDGGPKLLAAGDFHPAGADPSADLELVDGVVDPLA